MAYRGPPRAVLSPEGSRGGSQPHHAAAEDTENEPCPCVGCLETRARFVLAEAAMDVARTTAAAAIVAMAAACVPPYGPAPADPRWYETNGRELFEAAGTALRVAQAAEVAARAAMEAVDVPDGDELDDGRQTANRRPTASRTSARMRTVVVARTVGRDTRGRRAAARRGRPSR
jgi:hypothetical protein